jgi:hypothetical protein
MLAQALPRLAGQPVAHYRITSPAPGAVLSGTVPIEGMAVFDPSQVVYYKVEWGVGGSPSEWTTMGDIHNGPLTNGVLEVLHADALPPGPAVVRLILVKNDGNFMTPYAVPIRVERSG